MKYTRPSRTPKMQMFFRTASTDSRLDFIWRQFSVSISIVNKADHGLPFKRTLCIPYYVVPFLFVT